MPKNKTSDPSGELPRSDSAASDVSSERTDWDRKLSEARAKRAEVLSARASGQSPENTQVAKNPSASKSKPQPRPKRERVTNTPKEKPAPELAASQVSEAARVKFNLTDANALKALFVFCGAAGFGIGTVVGFGILVGMGVSAPTEIPSVAKAFVSAEVVESPLPVASDQTVQVSKAESPQSEIEVPTQSDYVTPMEAAQSVVLEPAEVMGIDIEALPLVAKQPVSPALPPGVVQALPDMLDKDIGSFIDPEGQVSLPSISNVRYMREDLPEIDAVYLRSLPEVDELQAAIFPEVQAGDPEPEFYMHAPDGLSDAQLRRIIAQLEANGVEVSKIGREGFRVSTTHLRYYSPETAEIATAVAKDLGVTARDFSQNAPVSSRIEVWVAGNPKPIEEEEETSRGVFYWLGQGRREER